MAKDSAQVLQAKSLNIIVIIISSIIVGIDIDKHVHYRFGSIIAISHIVIATTPTLTVRRLQSQIPTHS
jgi:hypothetical protein